MEEGVCVHEWRFLDYASLLPMKMGHCALIGAGHFGVILARKTPFLCPAESFVGNKRQIPGNNPAF